MPKKVLCTYRFEREGRAKNGQINHRIGRRIYAVVCRKSRFEWGGKTGGLCERSEKGKEKPPTVTGSTPFKRVALKPLPGMGL
ncbi:hypothetical protein [Shouchella miscanthi]|uniref:hypothetical protein n=1 Tax=Shouchella miscanthi TaxID=2598861 RepID=UPI0011A49A49|nr:hypothetical protein [Shouchella miscanthi]